MIDAHLWSESSICVSPWIWPIDLRLGAAEKSLYSTMRWLRCLRLDSEASEALGGMRSTSSSLVRSLSV